MIAEPKKKITLEEYFELEKKSGFKSEYHGGEILAMSGANINHVRITRNAANALTQKLKGKRCEAFALDLKVFIESADRSVYPDVLVICGKPQFHQNRKDTVLNPTIIIEVLSASTKNYDKGEKFDHYRTLPSLQEYLLVDQSKVYLEHFQKTGEAKWTLEEHTAGKNVVRLAAIDAELTLAELYEDVDWDMDNAVQTPNPSSAQPSDEPPQA